MKRLLASGIVYMMLCGGMTACHGSSRAPSWVEGAPLPAYPPDEYVTAIGTGRDLEEAVAHAKAELSRIFSAELESKLELVEFEQWKGGRTQGDTQLTVETRIETEIVFEGAEVPVHWRESDSGRVWALAVLERVPECRRIRDEAGLLLERIEGDRDGRVAPGPALLGLRATMRTAARSRELDRLEARSRVLGLRCVPGRAETTGSIEREVADRRSTLTFMIETEWVLLGAAESDPFSRRLPHLEEKIAANLVAMGFRVGPSSGAEVVPIGAHLRLQRLERGARWAEYRWEGAFQVGRTPNGQAAVLGGQGEGSESHPEPEVAFLRARVRAEQDLSRQLDTLLRAYLEVGEDR